jgi:hypothetical protein
MATSADGGASWQAVDAGKLLGGLQSVMPGGCAETTTISATEVFSPDVIVDGANLLMVFERRGTDPTGASGWELAGRRFVTRSSEGSSFLPG